MVAVSDKIKLTVLGAILFPCFARINLSGTSFEYDIGRYFVPFIFGGLSGYIIGLTKEKWQASKGKFRPLVETTSDWVWEVDQNGIYTYTSPKVEEVLGYTPQELIGEKTPFDFMSADDAKRVGSQFKKIVVSCKAFDSMENVNIHKDGRIVILETSGVPFFDKNGNLKGYRGIDRDITQRKQIEKTRDTLLNNLQSVLDNVKTLRGILPICAKCKKIRDDQGSWNQIEEYIQKHSDAEFSHGICPECSDKLYSRYDWYKKKA